MAACAAADDDVDELEMVLPEAASVLVGAAPEYTSYLMTPTKPEPPPVKDSEA